MEAEGYSLPVIEAHCEYRQSARYDDELDIATTGAMLSPVRVRFDYEVVRAADEAVLRRGLHGARRRSIRAGTAAPAARARYAILFPRGK